MRVLFVELLCFFLDLRFFFSPSYYTYKTKKTKSQTLQTLHQGFKGSYGELFYICF